MRLSPVTPSGLATSGTGEAASFEMAMNGHMFEMLSKRMYNDPKLAIVRELSCNSWDAHVAAGKRDVPFELHLPTPLEPFFMIKDFGTGFETFERLKHLYCGYGNSSKNDSNDQVGAFGIGSKSPFAYTNGFMVTNRYNGVKTVYACAVSNENLPKIIPMGEPTPTDEPNGLEVQFPVKESDCWEFENKAKIALEFFNPRPTLNVELDIAEPTYVLRTEKWGIRRDAYTNQTRGLRAIQGMVQYAVGNIDESRMTPEQSKMEDLPLDLFFPIGSLSIAPNREQLHLDDQTVDNILALLDEIYADLIEEIKKKVNEAKQPWEAQLMIADMVYNSPIKGIVNEALNQGLLYGQYKNFTLNAQKPSLNEKDFNETMIYSFSHNWRYRRGNTAKRASKNNVFHVDRAAWVAAHGKDADKETMVEFEVNNQVAFVVNDMPKGHPEKYIHHLIQETENGPKTVYLFTFRDKDNLIDFTKESSEAFKLLGNPNVITVSSLAKRFPDLDVKSPKARKQRELRKLLVMTGNGYSRGAGWKHSLWSAAKIDELPSGKKFYVPVLKSEVQGVSFANAERFADFVKNVRGSRVFGIGENTPIYGMRTKSRLQKSKEWVNLLDHVFATLATVMTPSKELEMSLQLRPFSFNWKKLQKRVAADATLLSPASPMAQFLTSLTMAESLTSGQKEANEKLVYVMRVAENFGKFEGAKNPINFNSLYKDIVKQYPMLEMASSWDTKEYTEILLDYVRLVDAQTAAASLMATSVPAVAVPATSVADMN